MKHIILTLTIGLLVSVQAYGQEETPPPPFNMPPPAAWSVFNESFQNRDFDFAIQYGRWLVNYRPTTMEGFENVYRGDRNFSRMITIYNHFAENSADPRMREAYVDSALTLYDRALAIFTPEQIDMFRWRLDRARFIQTNASRIEDGRQMTLQEYLELFEENPNQMTELADGYYVDYIVRELLTFDNRDRAIEIMNQAEGIKPDLKPSFDEIRSTIFRSPDERIVFINQQLESDPDNLELKKELFELYQRVGNNEKVAELAQYLYEVEPTFENIMRMAEFADRNAQYREAIRFFSEAIEVAPDARSRAEVNLRISDNYNNMRELQRARTYARRAADQAPAWGSPLIRIAEIYAQTITDCAGGQLDRRDKMVYWLVLDYLDRAERVDDSVRNQVQRLRPAYAGVMPTAEEKFYMNLETGDTVRIDGSVKECYDWIGESTTVR